MNSNLESVVPLAMFWSFHILTFVACIHDLVTWPTSWRFGHQTALQTSPHSPPTSTTLELVGLHVFAQAPTPALLSPRPSRHAPPSRTHLTWSRTFWGAPQATLRRKRWKRCTTLTTLSLSFFQTPAFCLQAQVCLTGEDKVSQS